MPKDPLIFIQVALVGRMADNIQHLLDEGSPTFDAAQADTAVFYSISSTQAGLRGVPLGNFLIKRVVDSLRQDFPRLKTFATLSPVPMFRRWLEQEFADHPERSRVTVSSGKASETLDLAAALKQEAWHEHAHLRAMLEGPLLQLCAEFLLAARREGRPIDPVARFHLGNGARVERINWLADTSAKGLRQSFGIMVNYVYATDEIEPNHEAYERDGEVIASSAVRKLRSRPVRVAG
jgi:malonyl-CoA decarboxylase